jgi:hypothetical protein
MVCVEGDWNIPESKRFVWGIPRFHMPRFGGWRDYVVVCPVDPQVEWHAGWDTYDVTGVSRIVNRGPVRLLTHRWGSAFFAISADNGEQIALVMLGTGRVGDGGPYRKVKML